jgi:hypothetical protein
MALRATAAPSLPASRLGLRRGPKFNLDTGGFRPHDIAFALIAERVETPEVCPDPGG